MVDGLGGGIKSPSQKTVFGEVVVTSSIKFSVIKQNTNYSNF